MDKHSGQCTPGRPQLEEWPARFKRRHIKQATLEIRRLAQLWRGEIDDEYGVAATISTAAIALQLTGKADKPGQALTLAREMWNNRPRDKCVAAAQGLDFPQPVTRLKLVAQLNRVVAVPRTSDKRERLLRSADRLILSHGFRQTTLADIARDSNVPLGNVYYYFKTKEDICKSIVETRVESMQLLLEKISSSDDHPKLRLLQLLDYPLSIRKELTDKGCPLGTLSYELSRNEGVLGQSSAQLIAVVLDWARQQFEAMGKPDADALALQLISNLQGMSLIANALQDPGVVDKMVGRTRGWLNSL